MVCRVPLDLRFKGYRLSLLLGYRFLKSSLKLPENAVVVTCSYIL